MPEEENRQRGASSPDRVLLYTARMALKALADSVSSQVEALDALPAALEQVLGYSRNVLSREVVRPSSPFADVEMEAFAWMVDALAPFEKIPFDSAEEATQLEIFADANRNRMLHLPNHETKGSPWLAFHGSVDQWVRQASAGLESLQGLYSGAVDGLATLAEHGHADTELAAVCVRSRSALEHAWGACTASTVRRDSLKSLARCAYEILSSLPSARPLSPIAGQYIPPTRRFRIVVVEDEKKHQEFVRRAVENLQDRLNESYSIEAEFYGDLHSALSALAPASGPVAEADTGAEPSDGVEKNGKRHVQTIVVADMGLPDDPEDQDAIRQSHRSTPDRKNGLKLLRRLRSYALNIPCIVLTTPSQSYVDPVQVCSLGIHDAHYILKGVDKADRLTQALFWITIERSRRHTVRLRLPDGQGAEPSVTIDDIPIRLTDKPFQVFYALCHLSKNSNSYAGGWYEPYQVLEQVGEDFGRKFNFDRMPEQPIDHALLLARDRSGDQGGDWWVPEEVNQIASVMLCWSSSSRKANGDLVRALGVFKSEYYRAYKDAWVLFLHYCAANPDAGAWVAEAKRKDTPDPRLIAEGYEAVFGGVQASRGKDTDVEDVKKQISTIRASIHLSFSEAHRYLGKTEVLQTREDPTCYRIEGEIDIELPPGEDDGLPLEKYAGVDDVELEDEELLEEDDEDEPESSSEDRVYHPVTRPAPTGGTGYRPTVLVVENEQSYSDRMARLLKNSGFEVVIATNVEDALVLARAHLPAILSLDLAVPMTAEEYERNPGGDPSNGLKLLEAIRKERRPEEFRVLVPTAYYAHSDLQEWAMVLGVPVVNIVPKGISAGGARWEGHYILTARRLRDEVYYGLTLAPDRPDALPVVGVENSSDLARGRLLLTVNGEPCPPVQAGKQGKLLAFLLSPPETERTFAEIDQAVAGSDPVTEDARKGWIKNVREKIRNDWLGLAEPERPEKGLLREYDGRIVLDKALDVVVDPSSKQADGPLQVVVRGRRAGVPRGYQSRLVLALLEAPNRSLTVEQADQVMEARRLSKDARGERITQLQHTIRIEWLGLSEVEWPEREILEDTGGGLRLNAIREDVPDRRTTGRLEKGGQV